MTRLTPYQILQIAGPLLVICILLAPHVSA
jgi:hypothetical protein